MTTVGADSGHRSDDGRTVTLLERQTALVGLAPAPVKPKRQHRRLNPYAALPYLIGGAIFAVEVFAIV